MTILAWTLAAIGWTLAVGLFALLRHVDSTIGTWRKIKERELEGVREGLAIADEHCDSLAAENSDLLAENDRLNDRIDELEGV